LSWDKNRAGRENFWDASFRAERGISLGAAIEEAERFPLASRLGTTADVIFVARQTFVISNIFNNYFSLPS
jgi:hypothetical protein